MTTGEWNPLSGEQSPNYSIETGFLKAIMQKFNADEPEAISSILTTEEKNIHRPVMLLPKETWFEALEPFNDEELISLIQFFTLAEVSYENWSAEEKSPVIWITKFLKRRGKTLDKDLLKWIKSNNKNKFLPFGAL